MRTSAIAADVEQDWRIVDLEQALGVERFCPVNQAAAVDIARGGQFLLGTFESLFLGDGLCDKSRQAACFEFGERSAENRVRRPEALQEASGQTRGKAGRESQGEPGEGCV